MPSETIKLTAKFKLKETPEGLDELFQTYREIVNFLITHAFENNVTSFYRLKKETYKTLHSEGENPVRVLPCKVPREV
ncbi:hypothetical protein PYCH_06540 [Pyrococcus yayanosii CH1]|uniref:Uncharacterized protein n=1 Tax=Pyrococcus yayanosii (strain CH1 / JCM 16557) TaxID=529709 RepID=F8AIH6_PYRYC|nr:hypothetical protein PYCH_06540 [Pyrococcus yayanosii CH1]